MYNVFQHVPGHACNYRIQVFHVLEHQGTGGETLLVDGFFAAETLRQDNPTAFKCLSETVVAHEFYDSDHRVRSLGTVLSFHPTTKKMLSIRYITLIAYRILMKVKLNIVNPTALNYVCYIVWYYILKGTRTSNVWHQNLKRAMYSTVLLVKI